MYADSIKKKRFRVSSIVGLHFSCASTRFWSVLIRGGPGSLPAGFSWSQPFELAAISLAGLQFPIAVIL
jgi:hypothetical protein